MRMTSTLLAVLLLICMIAVGTAAAEFAGPRLEGTVTLRGGQTISGLILTAQLGIVDGAEIGSRLRDGGYIAVDVDGEEHRVQATEIARLDAEWEQTGTEDAPQWKITELSITTRDGETLTGTPAWLVHATSLIIEEEDGTQKRVYAFPMAGSNFSPDNLLASLVIDTDVEPVAPVTEEPVTEEPVTEEPVTEEPVTEEPVTEEPVTEEPRVTVTPVEDDEEEAPVTPDLGIGAAPVVEELPEDAVFASGQPAVVTFEVTNPETGRPMQVRFLIVPLPAQ